MCLFIFLPFANAYLYYRFERFEIRCQRNDSITIKYLSIGMFLPIAINIYQLRNCTIVPAIIVERSRRAPRAVVGGKAAMWPMPDRKKRNLSNSIRNVWHHTSTVNRYTNAWARFVSTEISLAAAAREYRWLSLSVCSAILHRRAPLHAQRTRCTRSVPSHWRC